jgi:hypothetical protein
MRSQSPPLVSAGHWALASIGIGIAFLWDDTSQCTEIGISYKSVLGELQLFFLWTILLWILFHTTHIGLEVPDNSYGRMSTTNQAVLGGLF